MEEQTCPKCDRVEYYDTKWETSTYMNEPCEGCQLKSLREENDELKKCSLRTKNKELNEEISRLYGIFKAIIHALIVDKDPKHAYDLARIGVENEDTD